MESFPWSDELEEKFTDLWQTNECRYDVSSNSYLSTGSTTTQVPTQADVR